MLNRQIQRELAKEELWLLSELTKLPRHLQSLGERQRQQDLRNGKDSEAILSSQITR